jgi:hypothetical protein
MIRAAVNQADDGKWWVTVDGEKIAGPFLANADAWTWIDRNGQDGRNDDDRHRRIQTAFGDR